jgi:hypothetical protein
MLTECVDFGIIYLRLNIILIFGGVKMSAKKLYISSLAARMRSAGENNWSYNDKADICELAGVWCKFLDTKTDSNEEKTVVLKAARILGVEIRQFVEG